jgi:predicted phage terminase large subunit-like protein
MLSTLAPRQNFAVRSAAHRTLERIDARIRSLNQPDSPIDPVADLTRAAKPELSLRQFLEQAWDVLEPSRPFRGGWHIDAMCQHAEAIVTGKSPHRRLLVNIPPGTTKSLVFSVALPCWVWTFRPSFKWVCASYDQDTANDLANKRRHLLISPWYSNRWAGAATMSPTATRKARDTIKMIVNIYGGEMLATSPGGRLIGKHPDGGILDDLHNPKDDESLSAVSLAGVRNFMEGVLSTRGAAADISMVLFLVMQRLAEEDASKVMQEWGPCERLIFPMRYEPVHPVFDPKQPTSQGFIDPRTEPGQLLCPERFPAEVVDHLEKVLRPHRAAGQLQQRPTNPQGDRFQKTWFKTVMPFADVPAEVFTGRAGRYWDCAATQGGGDHTAGVSMVAHGGKFYVFDVCRGQWSTMNRKAEQRRCAEADSKLFPHYTMHQEEEGGSSGKDSTAVTQAEFSDYRFEGDHVTGKKETRWNEWEQELEAGNVILIEGAWNHAFISEHVAWRWNVKDQTDDQIDAASRMHMKLRRRRSLIAGAV